MNRGKVAVAAIAVVVLLGAAGSLFYAISTEAIGRSELVSAQFSVERLTCGSCVENIRQALSGLDGIASVETNVSLGQTLVRFDPAKIDTTQIARVMTASGYPAQLYAHENEQGEMTTEVDSTLYIARIGDRLIPRVDFNELVEEQRQLAATSGQALPIRSLARFAWMTILQRELLISAATEAGIVVANAELDADLLANQLPATDREKRRTDLLLDRYLKQHNIDKEANSPQVTAILLSLQRTIPVQIFDESLKASLSGSAKNRSGCGGSCCG